MVTEMRSIVENARKEASMTSEIVKTLNEAAMQLAAAEKQSEEYLKAVSDVLGKAHESFAENVTRTLREGNRQFQKELGDAVGLLSGAIKDLGDTLDDLPAKR
jgi:ABC-type transporter Mla subunit MlaD